MSDLIFKYLEDPNFEVRREAILTLFNRSYVPDDDKLSIVNEVILNISNTINKLTALIHNVKDRELRNLIYNEIYHIQMKNIFHCMALNYSKKLFRDVIENCYSSLKTNKTLARELLDNSLIPRDKRIIVPLMESIFDIKDNVQISDEEEGFDISELIREVLNNGNEDYSSWLTANFIRISASYNIALSFDDGLYKNDIHLIRQEGDRLKQMTA
jgi:hypothetical protein